MRRLILKGQEGLSGMLDPLVITGSYKKMPSLMSKTTYNYPSLTRDLTIDENKRNSVYQNMFGKPHDEIVGLGLDPNNYESAKDLKKDLNSQPKGQIGGQTGNALGGIAQGVGTATNLLQSIVPHKGGDDTNESGQMAIGNALISTGIPLLAAAGAGFNALSLAGSATGTNSSQLNDTQSDKIGITKGQKFLNNALSFIPMAGAFMGKTDDAYKSLEVDKVRGGFAGTADDIDVAGTMGGGKRYTKTADINNFIREQNQRNDLLTNISLTNTLRKQSSYGQDLNMQNYKRYSGENYQTHLGKQGLKLLTKEELDKIYAVRELVNIKKYQNGGSILIPEGELHKTLHHMDEVNPALAEDLTKKGIPVVVTKEGEVEQVAEIEKEEIIFEKSLTDKIEDLWKNGSEESMIKAGKLIVDTLFNNCDDNVGLINKIN